jgi:hypothetical protein
LWAAPCRETVSQRGAAIGGGCALFKRAFARVFSRGLGRTGRGVSYFATSQAGGFSPVRFFRVEDSRDEFSALPGESQVAGFFKRKQADLDGTGGAIGTLRKRDGKINTRPLIPALIGWGSIPWAKPRPASCNQQIGVWFSHRRSGNSLRERAVRNCSAVR